MRKVATCSRVDFLGSITSVYLIAARLFQPEDSLNNRMLPVGWECIASICWQLRWNLRARIRCMKMLQASSLNILFTLFALCTTSAEKNWNCGIQKTVFTTMYFTCQTMNNFACAFAPWLD